MLFNGDLLTWKITMYDNGRKISLYALASSYSVRCKKGYSSGRESTDLLVQDMAVPTATSPLVAYPNPVDQFISVVIPDDKAIPSSSNLAVLDQSGRPRTVPTTWSPQSRAVIFDFSSLSRGFYVIKIQFPNEVKMLKVYKN